MMGRGDTWQIKRDVLAWIGWALVAVLVSAGLAFGSLGLRSADQFGAAVSEQKERAVGLGRVATGFADLERRVMVYGRDNKQGGAEAIAAVVRDLRAMVLATRNGTQDLTRLQAADRLMTALDGYDGEVSRLVQGKASLEVVGAALDAKGKGFIDLIQAGLQETGQAMTASQGDQAIDAETLEALAPTLGGFGLVLGGLLFWWNKRRAGRLASDIGAITGDLRSVFSALAEGDLTQQVGGKHLPVFVSMADDVNATIEKLAGMVTRINEAAGMIANAAAEVATGGSDLADRTERQAAALEETSAALEQLANTFKGYCEHAHEANAMVANARLAGESGVVVVATAIEAMQRIVAASEKIKEIIRVTEEISRRTNMLAINAAVEAARAGEAGKGFGVVAREVGSLAERSALASQQIKDLIFNSDNEIRQGVKMVTQSGDALQTIVGSVDQAAALFNDIAISAASQSGMLHEINIAVTQMDETTQMNAALAEETCAASQSMRQEARALKELVSFFMLNRDAQSQGLGRHIVLIESTKLDHLSFMKRVREAIAGERDTKPEHLADHHQCRLGKWYDHIELPVVRQNMVYRTLERPHALVHEAARCALQRHAAGDRAGCEQSLAEMTQASAQVMALIDDLAADLRNHEADEEATGKGRPKAARPQPRQAAPQLRLSARPEGHRLTSAKPRDVLRHVEGGRDRDWAEF